MGARRRWSLLGMPVTALLASLLACLVAPISSNKAGAAVPLVQVNQTTGAHHTAAATAQAEPRTIREHRAWNGGPGPRGARRGCLRSACARCGHHPPTRLAVCDAVQCRFLRCPPSSAGPASTDRRCRGHTTGGASLTVEALATLYDAPLPSVMLAVFGAKDSVAELLANEVRDALPVAQAGVVLEDVRMDAKEAWGSSSEAAKDKHTDKFQDRLAQLIERKEVNAAAATRNEYLANSADLGQGSGLTTVSDRIAIAGLEDIVGYRSRSLLANEGAGVEMVLENTWSLLSDSYSLGVMHAQLERDEADESELVLLRAGLAVADAIVVTLRSWQNFDIELFEQVMRLSQDTMGVRGSREKPYVWLVVELTQQEVDTDAWPSAEIHHVVLGVYDEFKKATGTDPLRIRAVLKTTQGDASDVVPALVKGLRLGAPKLASLTNSETHTSACSHDLAVLALGDVEHRDYLIKSRLSTAFSHELAVFRRTAAALAKLPVQQRHTAMRLDVAIKRGTDSLLQQGKCYEAMHTFRSTADRLDKVLHAQRDRAVTDLEGFLNEDIVKKVEEAFSNFDSALEQAVTAVRGFDDRQRSGQCCAPGIKYAYNTFMTTDMPALVSKYDLELRKECAPFEGEIEVEELTARLNSKVASAASVVQDLVANNLAFNAIKMIDTLYTDTYDEVISSVLRLLASDRNAASFESELTTYYAAIKKKFTVEVYTVQKWQGLRAPFKKELRAKSVLAAKRLETILNTAQQVAVVKEYADSAPTVVSGKLALLDTSKLFREYKASAQKEIATVQLTMDTSESRATALLDQADLRKEDRERLSHVMSGAGVAARAAMGKIVDEWLEKHKAALATMFEPTAKELLERVSHVLDEAARPGGHLAQPQEYRVEVANIRASAKEQLKRIALMYEMGSTTSALFLYEGKVDDLVQSHEREFSRALAIRVLGAGLLVFGGLALCLSARRQRRC